MRYKIFQTILLLIMGTVLNAQTLKLWVWDTYKLKFKAPDNLILQKNDATVYEAGNSNMYLDIYPRKGDNLTYDGMKNSIVNWAANLGLAYNTVNASGATQPIYLENLNGYWGCAIDGTSNKLPATAMVLVNPKDPEISFYIWINYKTEYYRDAVAVLKSFTPIEGSSTAAEQSKPVVKHKKKTTSSSVF
jgi:hypothetical protein